jgi:acyl-coenzyme A thioesterase PaaI-like protein
MLRAAKGERLECRAQVIKPGRSISFSEAEVYAVDGDHRELVAKASATMAVIAGR